MLHKLNSPRAVKPIPANQNELSVAGSLDRWFNESAANEQWQASWFAALDDESKEVFKNLLKECAELSAFGFLTLIDGVGGDYEGVFEIIAVDKLRKVINPQNTEMLHDLFSEICHED